MQTGGVCSRCQVNRIAGQIGCGAFAKRRALISTASASNDRVIVNGTATIDAGDSDDAINLNLSSVDGTFAQGTYALVLWTSVGGSATNDNYKVRVRDAQGTDITSGVRLRFG